jgi:hypothetical protein
MNGVPDDESDEQLDEEAQEKRRRPVELGALAGALIAGLAFIPFGAICWSEFLEAPDEVGGMLTILTMCAWLPVTGLGALLGIALGEVYGRLRWSGGQDGRRGISSGKQNR